jgi:hypothetical protein
MVTLCVKNDYDSVGWSLFGPPPASFSEKEAISTRKVKFKIPVMTS